MMVKFTHHVQCLLEPAKPGKGLFANHEIDVWVDLPDYIWIPGFSALWHMVFDVQIVHYFSDLKLNRFKAMLWSYLEMF